MKVILAVDKNRGIGKDNDMLYHLKKDLEHFKETTMGNTLIMGRSTYESMDGALPNRENIVLTTNRDYKADDALIFHSVEDILAYVKDKDDNEVFVIGGGQIVELFIDYINEAIITKIDGSRPADTYLHNFDEDPNFTLVEVSPTIEDEVNFNIARYRRK